MRTLIGSLSWVLIVSKAWRSFGVIGAETERAVCGVAGGSGVVLAEYQYSCLPLPMLSFQMLSR